MKLDIVAQGGFKKDFRECQLIYTCFQIKY